MRRLSLLLLVVLLAGCNQAPADAVPETRLEDAGGPPEGAVALPALGFGGQEQDLTQQFTGGFAIGEECVFTGALTGTCAARRPFDISPMLPAGQPVQVSLDLESQGAGPGSAIAVDLEFAEAFASRYEQEFSDDGSAQVTAVVVRKEGGTVTAVVTQYLPPMLPPSETSFTLTVRTVVRPEVLPTYLPVAVRLAPGDLLQASGDDLDDLVVIPPGQAPRHLLGPFDVNVTADDPTGLYVVVAKGQGDVRLHGPNQTLRPLPVEFQMGDPHAMSSQPVSWEFPSPGIPVFVGFTIEGAGSPAGQTTVGQAHGDFSIVVKEGPIELVGASATCGVCEFNPVGSSFSTYYSQYLDERMGLGPFTVEASFQFANSVQVRDLLAWIAAP